jgi:hypothetical protein
MLFTLTDFDNMVNCNLTIKNHIYSSTTKLSYYNEQGIQRILIMQLIGTSEP